MHSKSSLATWSYRRLTVLGKTKELSSDKVVSLEGESLPKTYILEAKWQFLILRSAVNL